MTAQRRGNVRAIIGFVPRNLVLGGDVESGLSQAW